MNKTPPQNIDAYIIGFPEAVQEILEKIRVMIHEMAPEAEETISYGIPSFTLNGYLVHFAAYKKHISIYPAPRGIEQFKDELAGYAGGKGTVQFPLDQPIPYDLIRRIVAFRIQENQAKGQTKAK